MKKFRNNSDRASTLQIALSTGLISIFAILLAVAAPANRKEAPRQNLSGFQLGEGADALGNYPDTSILLSTDTTVTPDVAPTNTTSINVSTSTNFKGKLEGYPDTGVVRITDAHPAGTYLVTVRALNGGSLIATKNFTLTVTTPPTCSPVSFAPATTFPAGSFTASVAVGDFNGDGNQDLAVGNSNGVAIVLGDGTGNFSAATNFAASGTEHYGIAVGDFNGDGKQDLVVANFDASNVSILLGNGAGSFTAATNFATGTNPCSVAVGDFNGDGKQDLAFAKGSGISILLGDGAGNFGAPSNFAAGGLPRSVVVGDFNGDGKQDLAVANVNSDNLSILFGNGAGSFSAPTNFTVGNDPLSVALGDFNGDGKQDLAAANSQGPYNVSVLLGNGAGNFSAAVNFPVVSQPTSVAVGDFNGDGKQDLVVSGAWILLGNGAGDFGDPINFGGSITMAVGDFNGDGKQDLASVDVITPVNILMRQECPPATPTPTPGCGGGVITHSTSQAIITQAPACAHPPPMPFAYDNLYWRAFNMQQFVGGAEYTVSSVSFGVLFSTDKTVTVYLFANNGAPFPAEIGTQIGVSTLTVTSGQGGTVVTTPLVATVPAGTNELVMLLYVPEGDGFLGAGTNAAPETGPSYWSSIDSPGEGCSSTPQVISNHLVFNVYGTCTGPTPTPTPSPGICGTLLYGQASGDGTATVSQNFEAANDGYDSQLADDFVVRAGSVWTIQRVNVSGTYFNGIGPAASVNVSFYSNSGTLPGAAVPGGTYTNLAMTDTAGNFSISLPTNLVLTSGTYWVSVQANMDFTPNGEWGWLDRTVQSNSPAAWQNPGGGFGFGCLTWGARAATCGVDPTAPDQIFQIIGCLGAPSPTPSPTPTPTPITISGTISYCSNPIPGPVPNVTLTLTGSISGTTLSDGSGNYTFSSLPSGGYTVTPTKTAVAPGSAGISTTDVVAVQRHFLNIGTPLAGCRLTAADVNGDTAVKTQDVIATQRFFLGLSTGIANTGKYQFTPVNRTYPGLVFNQTGQNYDTLVFGDVASPFAE